MISQKSGAKFGLLQFLLHLLLSKKKSINKNKNKKKTSLNLLN